MCGICGFMGPGDRRLVGRMTDTMVHRGPDARGTHVQDGVSLGQRRLSIIDTSEQGNQPMCNKDRTLWLVYNEEIYNFRPLLEGSTAASSLFVFLPTFAGVSSWKPRRKG